MLPFPRNYWKSYPPEYPTLDPVSSCENRKWVFASNQENIDVVQSNCMDLINQNVGNGQLNDIDFGFPVSGNPNFGEYSFELQQMLNSGSATPKCLESAAKGFPYINTYCKKKDGQLISPYDLQEICTKGGKVDDFICVNPDNYLYREQTLPAVQDPGLYLCSKDGKLSHNACPFNKLEMERKLDQGFRNTYCPVFTRKPGDLETCKKKGWFFDPANNTVYVNRGNVMFGMDPNKFDLGTKVVERQEQERSQTQGPPNNSPINVFYNKPAYNNQEGNVNPNMPNVIQRETLPDMRGKDKICSIM
jgi:hypothetical protein